MSKIVFDNGKVIELSDETTERLKKELFPYEAQPGDVVEDNDVGHRKRKCIIVKYNDKMLKVDMDGKVMDELNVGGYWQYEPTKIGTLRDYIK